MKKSLWAGAAGLLALASGLVWAVPSPGTKAPAFKQKDLGGKPVALASLKGKPVVYNIWSAGCPFSQNQMPAVDKLAAKYKGKVAFIGSNVDLKGADLKKYAQKHGLKQKVVSDSDKMVARAYGATTTPTAYLIDKKGMIAAVYQGYTKGDENQLDMDIDLLLKGGNPQMRRMMKPGGG